MTHVERVYAPPGEDSEPHHEVQGGDDEDESPPSEWYAIPVGRLFLFGLLGGHVYLLHFMYRSWAAHRRSFGYSASELWRARYETTGFRISPFWRAALGVYSYSWLLVVQREARRARLPLLAPAGFWFVLHVSTWVVSVPWWSFLAPSLVFLSTQQTVNRLHDRATSARRRAPVTAGELCWLVFGILGSMRAVMGQQPW